MANFQSLLQSIRASVSEVEVSSVKAELESEGLDHLIDVREPGEFSQGSIEGAICLPRGFIEARIEKHIPNKEANILVYCAGGTRSAFAARSLAELGYQNVRSLMGGFTAWKQAGFNFSMPEVLGAEQAVRYSRHTTLQEVGEKGQLELLRRRVLLVGAGGLGSPAAMYLAAAGVGTLGIVDDDVVDISNLQRQVVHGTSRIGMPKVESAALTIAQLNPDVQVNQHRLRLDSKNVLEVIADYDVIVDGADNFQTRYLLNDAALRTSKPLVHASVFRFEGQLTVFAANGGPCYRCLYPEPPPSEESPSCSEAGVVGVLPGIMGTLQATEVVKLLLKKGRDMTGRLLIYDALETKFREIKLKADPNCSTCGDGVLQSSIDFVDYGEFCRGASLSG